MATKKRRPVCKFTRTKSAAKTMTCKKMKNGTWLCCPKKKAAKKARKARRR
jgi:hypothetical protein